MVKVDPPQTNTLHSIFSNDLGFCWNLCSTMIMTSFFYSYWRFLWKRSINYDWKYWIFSSYLGRIFESKWQFLKFENVYFDHWLSFTSWFKFQFQCDLRCHDNDTLFFSFPSWFQSSLKYTMATLHSVTTTTSWSQYLDTPVWNSSSQP